MPCAVAQVNARTFLQALQDRNQEYSAQTKQLNATILHLEEKLAKYLKIEEEFSALELPLGYTNKSFSELITKYNEIKVGTPVFLTFLQRVPLDTNIACSMYDRPFIHHGIQEELMTVKAELLERQATWDAEKELLLQNQTGASQPIMSTMVSHEAGGAEDRLREQLRRQSKMVRALRDVIKQLGVSAKLTPCAKALAVSMTSQYPSHSQNVVILVSIQS